MTHLSDFSYLQRCALEVYMGIFLLYRVWSNDRLKCLHPKRILAGELRSVITVLYLMTLILQTSWDVVSTWIKYSETFMVLPTTGKIISKPFEYWTEEHQNIAESMDYVEAVNLSLQTGIFFLLQCFWNYLSNVVAKKSFMSSLEFRFYIFWALGSVAVFPTLQWYFRDDVHTRETAPQLAYSIEVLIVSVLGVRSHFRFNRILNISRNLKHGGTAIVDKLAYFKEMNMYLTCILFFYGVSLGILCVDGLTTAKVINYNKFAADLLIANCNMSSVLMWIVGISIFHPRRSNAEIEASVSSRSITGANTFQTSHHHYGDIEIANSSNRFNGSSSSEGINGNGQRLSQRITNFVENKNRFGSSNGTSNNNSTTLNESTLNDFTSKEIIGHSNNGSFMRPMSPVNVDYSNERTFTPTHHFTSGLSPSSPTVEKKVVFNSRNVSVDDPYTNHPINFTMVEPSDKRFNSPPNRGSYEGAFRSASPEHANGKDQQEYPMQTISSAVSSNHDDFRFDPLMEDYDSYSYPQSPLKAKTNNNHQHF